jgi:hypothetical protein
MDIIKEEPGLILRFYFAKNIAGSGFISYRKDSA